MPEWETVEEYWALLCVRCGHRNDEHRMCCMCGSCDLPCLIDGCGCVRFDPGDDV